MPQAVARGRRVRKRIAEVRAAAKFNFDDDFDEDFDDEVRACKGGGDSCLGALYAWHVELGPARA